MNLLFTAHLSHDRFDTPEAFVKEMVYVEMQKTAGFGLVHRSLRPWGWYLWVTRQGDPTFLHSWDRRWFTSVPSILHQTNMSLKYNVIWWKQTTLTLNTDCETIDILFVACYSQVVNENNRLPLSMAINNIIKKIAYVRKLEHLTSQLFSDMAYILMVSLGVQGLGNKVGRWCNVWPHGGSGQDAAAGRYHRIQHGCLSRECRLKEISTFKII